MSADGSVVQEHTEKGLDGLAPAGTVTPLAPDPSGRTPRVGVLLDFGGAPTLFVSQPDDDSIKVLTLAVTGPKGSEVYRLASTRELRAPELSHPVDLAPAAMETTSTSWASNTTMQPGTDLYVANRGNGTIARVRQDGTVVAVRAVRIGPAPLPSSWKLNGIATSLDRTRIWVTFTGTLAGPGTPDGGVIELSAF